MALSSIIRAYGNLDKEQCALIGYILSVEDHLSLIKMVIIVNHIGQLCYNVVAGRMAIVRKRGSKKKSEQLEQAIG